jgi:DNA-binding transcriptional MerR regulator
MESPETFSVKQTADLIGKAPNTLRTWSGPDHFGPYLSPYANPGPGEERRFTEHDIRLLKTAVLLQKRGLAIGDIIPRIASGEILEELPEEFPERLSPELERGSSENLPVPQRYDPASQLSLYVRPYEVQIERLSADLEGERARLEEEREARITAEKELSRLSAILEEREKPWYKRLFGGG